MAGRYKIRRAGWGTSYHTVPIKASIGKRANKFQACAMTGSDTRHHQMAHACALASNPRKALGEALKRLGSRVAMRSGAFAKFAGYSKSNRRRRRSRRAAKRRY